MAWLLLFVAGLMEIGWAIGLKYTEGFTRLVPSVLTLACMIAQHPPARPRAQRPCRSAPPMRCGPGIGTVGTAILGIALFGEPATVLRLASIGLIVSGIVGLKLVT